MTDQAASSVAEVAASVATKATYAGSTATVLGALANIDWVAVTGLLIAILGFALNAYFQIRKNKREELELMIRIQHEQDKHEIEMQKLKGGENE